MPSPAASKPAVSGAFVAAQRALLEQERAQITAGIAAADRDLAEMRDRNDGAEVDFSEEGGEGAATGSERGQIESLRAQLAGRLDAVEAAAARLEAGTYGLCEACGGPIGEARLEALPDATLCVACKSDPWTARRGQAR